MESTMSSERLRSVTPSSGWRGPSSQSAASRALNMGLIEAGRCPDSRLSPTHPHFHAFQPKEKTPGLHVEDKPLMPICLDVIERVEAMDMSEEEMEELLEKQPWHVQRWLKNAGDTLLTPLIPSTTSNEVTTEVDVRRSSLGMTSSRRMPINDGSEFDSEFDDEFDVIEVTPSASKDIPDNEELEEPIKQLVNEVTTGMDDAADRLLGTWGSFNWTSDFESFMAVRENFSGPTPGPVKDYDTPYDSFTDIWSENIIELIVQETNRYAQQTIAEKRETGTLKVNSRLLSWTDTNADEIMLLFAMFMYMAFAPRTSLAEYWTTYEVLDQPGFRSLMSYNRYILLNKFLHFVDNTAAASQQLPQTGEAYSAGSAKLAKLDPIIEHLGKKFKALYNLGSDICIDESLTLFKDGLSWFQTIRSKAARFGIKSYELCESNTGYMAGFQIYPGKNDRHVGKPSIGVDLGGASTEVVLELLQGLEHRGHCVVMNNFYNCPSLARYLKRFLGFDCVGTLRSCRRNVPGDIANVSKVSKGTIIARHCGDVSIISWMDSKMVNIISTYHGPDTYVGARAGKPMVKPVCVRDYNRIMGGIDLKDQKLSMYLLDRKRGLKWYIKMFKRLLNVSIHNAFVMYVCSLKRCNRLPMTHHEFRYDLAASLFKRHRPCLLKISRPVGTLMRLRRDVVHEPEYKRGQNSRKRCVICYRKNETKLVHSRCISCDVYLCFEYCWSTWHSASDLPGKDKRTRKPRPADE